MSAVSCATLPDLGERAENGAAGKHCGPRFRVQAPLKEL